MKNQNFDWIIIVGILLAIGLIILIFRVFFFIFGFLWKIISGFFPFIFNVIKWVGLFLWRLFVRFLKWFAHATGKGIKLGLAKIGAAIMASLTSMCSVSGTPVTNDWRLVLVDIDHPLEEEYAESIELATLENNEQVDARILDGLNGLLEDAVKDGVDLYVSSGFRTSEKQAALFERKVTMLMNTKDMTRQAAEEQVEKILGKASYDEHETGLAIDIVPQAEQDMQAMLAWLQDNAWKHGFIQRYTEWGQVITGMEPNPTHFRYVGKEAAKEMQDEQITLEEYIDPVLRATEKMIGSATEIALDDSHGYDQGERDGPDYDCSSLVYECLKQARVEIQWEPHTTHNEIESLEKCGFIYIDDINQACRGDILITDGHTGIYLGDLKTIEASGNENGESHYGKTGDQTGKEIAIITYTADKLGKRFSGILRYVGK